MPGLPQIYPYKSGPMEPVVLPGETVGVWVNKQFFFFTVDFIEGISASDPMVIDLGAVGAGAALAAAQMLLIDMPTDEFGQFRAFVLDDVFVRMWQGRTDGRYRTRNTHAGIDLFSAIMDPDHHLTELYVMEDNSVWANAFNYTAFALAQCRIAFYGYRYVLSELKQYSWPSRVPNVWTRIPATAHL